MGAEDRPPLPPPVASPCGECPWRRDSAPGHLGPYSAKKWLRGVHGEEAIACHSTIVVSGSWEGARQCAGAAAFRANTNKLPRDPSTAASPRRADVFGSSQEFLDHHAAGEVWLPGDAWRRDP